jgi:pyridoxal phosphate enzyme (YggS family)
MKSALERYQNVITRIREAATRAGREPESVRLLAVSKKQSADLIRRFHGFGQLEFGENRAQEAVAKQAQLQDLNISWHFIGPVQSNKVRDLALGFDWIQSIDREKIIRLLEKHRPPGMPPINVCLQVNLEGEAQKSGIAAHAVPELAALVAGSPRLCLRGLMAIPRQSDDPSSTRATFRRIGMLYEDLKTAGHDLDTLSIGMSADLELAIEAGSTMVRVGTDLMGTRPLDA